MPTTNQMSVSLQRSLFRPYLMVFGSALITIAAAIVIMLIYPDKDNLNRLYAGIYISISLWPILIWLWFAYLKNGKAYTQYVIHTWIGTICGSLLFLICLTGALSLIKDNINFWEARDQRIAVSDQINWPALFTTLATQNIDINKVTIMLPTPLKRQLYIQENSRRPVAPIVIDPNNMNVMQVPDAGISKMISQLHKSMYMGFFGRIIVSLFGLAMTMLIFSGVMMCCRQGKKVFRLRWRQGIRFFVLDLHRWIGCLLLPLLLVIAITGLFSGMGVLGTMTMSRMTFNGGMSEAMQHLMPNPVVIETVNHENSNNDMMSFTQLLLKHTTQHPDFVIERLQLKSWGTADAVLTLSGRGAGQLSTEMFEKYSYQVLTGELVQHDSAAKQGIWTQAFIGTAPLHQAGYGGNAIQVVYALGGVIAALLALSGTWVWLSKRIQQYMKLKLIAGAMMVSAGGFITALSVLLMVTSLPISTGLKSTWQIYSFWGSWTVIVFYLFFIPIKKINKVLSLLVISALSLLTAAVVDMSVSVIKHQSWTVMAPAVYLDMVLLVIAFAMLQTAKKIYQRIKNADI